MQQRDPRPMLDSAVTHKSCMVWQICEKVHRRLGEMRSLVGRVNDSSRPEALSSKDQLNGGQWREIPSAWNLEWSGQSSAQLRHYSANGP